MRVLRTITGWTAGLAACVLMFSVTSCSNNENAELTDPQIASVAVTANQIDIDYGKIALEKSDNPEVKKFAETMTKDHQDIIDQAVALAKELGVTPEDNDLTQSLLDGAKATKVKFAELEGVEFDKAYIENEVAYHKAAIALVTDSLIPTTKNEKLKELLVSAGPLFKHHLEMAETAQKTILQTDANRPKLNDAQIASVAVTANQVDVDYGKIALQKSDNDEVKKFAETMIKDHNDIIAQAVTLVTKLGVTPEDNDVTQSLLDGEKSTSEKLNALDGAEFNKAYIENEVAYHQAVINAVKNILIPQAQNEELKETLIKITPLLEHHLEMAKKAQSDISQI